MVDRALAVLAVSAADLLTGQDAGRLNACGVPPYSRYLVRSHGRRRWCSTRCGDRVRAARPQFVIWTTVINIGWRPITH
jgi:predicted RNA-binding Zn ribbon-like protein